MNKKRLKEHVDVIRQAFGYINRFKNETFVIKIDSAVSSGELFPILIRDIVLLSRMGIRVIIVPGTRARINEVLAAYNIECPIVNGIRVSNAEAIPLIKMAAFDMSNHIMTMLAENEANAIIGNWVKAKAIGVRDGIDFQNSGIVENLQYGILKKILDEGIIPVFPNIGWSAKGKPYNLSSNDLAFNISVRMKATKLFFITESGCIKADGFKIPDDVYVSESGVISQLTVTQAEQFLHLNQEKREVIPGGLDSNIIAEAEETERGGGSKKDRLSLVYCAYRACSEGVHRVHIIDGNTDGMLLKEIFSSRGLGTMIYSNQHEGIRPMAAADIPGVLSLMQPQVEEGALVARTADDLIEKLDDYAVYEVDGTIHACGALHPFPGKQGEIAAIVVDDIYAKQGIGRKMVSYLIEKAAKMKMKSVFVLTTLTSDWFRQQGFTEAGISDLPEQKREKYNKNRNSLILKYPIPSRRVARELQVE